jgi:hypothetical protein
VDRRLQHDPLYLQLDIACVPRRASATLPFEPPMPTCRTARDALDVARRRPSDAPIRAGIVATIAADTAREMI